ncbi:uncharacterized protein N7446_010645 [Penicillium canescens]|uniref:uncharacterized protein n=1 Tax=Penicillium canescens TaxID=5083 RepID=UPI0026DF0EFF|nr:uncharacterized protein N7446_010645 [Penicillium canescens]KAJ6050536.1 hypothetical protein N7446_010645 [Penicillium canescens]
MFGIENDKAYKFSGKRGSNVELDEESVCDATNEGSNNSITNSHGQNGHVNYNTKDIPETPNDQPKYSLAFTPHGEELRIKVESGTQQMPSSDDTDAMDMSWPSAVEPMEKTPVADVNPIGTEEGSDIPSSTSLGQELQDNTNGSPGETPGQDQQRAKKESGISCTKSLFPDKPNNGGLSSSKANDTPGNTPTKDLLPLFTTPDRLSHFFGSTMSSFERPNTFRKFGVPVTSVNGIHGNQLGIPDNTGTDDVESAQISSPENSEARQEHSTPDGDLKAVGTTGQPETQKGTNILGNSAGQDEPISRKDSFYLESRLIGDFFQECFVLAALAVYWVDWVVCALGDKAMHNGLTVENCEAQLEENGSPHRVPSNIKTEARQDGAAELTSCSIAGGTIAPATTALPTTPGEFEPTSNAGQLKTGPNILDPNPPTVNYPEQPSTNPRGVDPCTVSLDSFYDLFEGSDTEESPTREGGKVTSTDPRVQQ